MLASHNYFNQKKTSYLYIPEVEVKINVYSTPTSFFHVPTFWEENLEDRKEEIIAIDCLLDSLKGHHDLLKLWGKKIRARKDQLLNWSHELTCYRCNGELTLDNDSIWYCKPCFEPSNIPNCPKFLEPVTACRLANCH